jgi:hypothetical protein
LPDQKELVPCILRPRVTWLLLAHLPIGAVVRYSDNGTVMREVNLSGTGPGVSSEVLDGEDSEQRKDVCVMSLESREKMIIVIDVSSL